MLVTKARQRMGAVNRLRPFLDSENLKNMYGMFARSIMEYGGVLFMGAADTHLSKMDKIQKSAERMGGFECESLKLRREAATVSLALKMLDGDCRSGLDSLKFLIADTPSCHSRNTKAAKSGIQLVPITVWKKSPNSFSRSFMGALPRIWSKLPHELIKRGCEQGWRKINASCKRYIKNNYCYSIATI